MRSQIAQFNIHLNKNVAKSYQCLAFVRRNLNYCPEKLRRLSYISLIRSKLEYSSSASPYGTQPAQGHSPCNGKWSSVGLHVLSLTIVMTVVYHKCLNISTHHLWKTEKKMNKLTLLYKMRNNLICIKENVYLKELTHALVTPAGIIS